MTAAVNTVSDVHSRSHLNSGYLCYSLKALKAVHKGDYIGGL